MLGLFHFFCSSFHRRAEHNIIFPNELSICPHNIVSCLFCTKGNFRTEILKPSSQEHLSDTTNQVPWSRGWGRKKMPAEGNNSCWTPSLGTPKEEGTGMAVGRTGFSSVTAGGTWDKLRFLWTSAPATWGEGIESQLHNYYTGHQIWGTLKL